MKPKQQSQQLLNDTRSKAKMYEYNVPYPDHIEIQQDPAKLFTISIASLGDLAVAINQGKPEPRELKDDLFFSACFFDYYLQSKLNETINSYLVLLGSASYYLCDCPGSALVLVQKITAERLNLEGGGLESLLLWLLRGRLNTYSNDREEQFSELISKISTKVVQFFKGETDKSEILKLVTELRKDVYEFGTPRQLLFGDTAAAILRKKIENSTWESLPTYSSLSREKWLQVLRKKSFIQELWPAQHFLGEGDVLKGKSAIIQMTTGTGKTKATELILRSAFLADRDVSLAIIIAPLRALCHEIKDNLVEAFQGESIEINELPDIFQDDFKIIDFSAHQQVLVVTPEKLLYTLRHDSTLVTRIGLLIFDEGHQFDSGARGITYELLLTSLHSMVSKGVQKVLISAVVSNANEIGKWLGNDTKVIKADLIPTFKSVGFTNWSKELGEIRYVNSLNPERDEFCVPRVIEKLRLEKKTKREKELFFPEKSDIKSIAFYLGLKIVSKGSVALFCGRKSIAESLCEKLVDVIEREKQITFLIEKKTPFVFPSEFSNLEEIKKLTHLHVENLGLGVPASRIAEHGIFFHHGNTPHGIRLAIEYAMRKKLVQLVICTSTLAQGVNLPIRYLIVFDVNQGKKRIKIRDFHNLIGRVGRAGMHTEGSILFANPEIYDNRKTRKRNSWKKMKKLLDIRNSEPCTSNLLSIFDPIKSDNGKHKDTTKALDFVKIYINDPDRFVEKVVEIIVKQNEGKGFTSDGVKRQVIWRINLICAIESFLLSHWDEPEKTLSETGVTSLAEGTLAFFLADEKKKEHIRELFQLIASNISNNLPNATRRKIFSRTMYGILDSQSIENWVTENTQNLLDINDETEVIEIFWPLLTKHTKNKIFSKIDPPEALQKIAHAWVAGKSFADISKIIQESGAIRRTIRKEFKIKIYDIIGICEEAFAYNGGLLIGAICEFVGTLNQEGADETVERLQFFQKRFKYGLKTRTSISLYEAGFSDRVVAQGIAECIASDSVDRNNIVTTIQENKDSIKKYITKFPSYFINLFERTVNS